MSFDHCPIAVAHLRGIARLSAVLVLVLLTGCPVPIPGSVRGEIRDETIRRIEPGATTRADVLLLLGDPDQRMENDSAFAFSWWQGYGGAIFIGPFRGYPGGATAGEGCHALAIQFTSDGTVARTNVFHGRTSVSGAAWFFPGVGTESGSGTRICTPYEFSDEIKAWLDEPAKRPQ